MHLSHPIPPEVLNDLKPEQVPQDVVVSARRMVLSEDHVSRNFTQLWGGGAWRGKSTLLVRRIFLPPGEMYRIYDVTPGSRRIYLAYLRRLKDLATRYSRQSWQMLHKQSQDNAISRNENTVINWLESSKN